MSASLFDQISTALSLDLREYPVCDYRNLDDLNPKRAAAESLRQSIWKKFLDENPETLPIKERESKAISLFLEAEASSSDYCPIILDKLRRKIDEMVRFTYPDNVNFIDIVPGLRTGPGTSRGVAGTTFLDKVGDSRLTTTSVGLYKLYASYVLQDPAWSAVELDRSGMHGSFELVQGSRLSFAPKTAKIERTIATEPSLNMMFQLGIGDVINRVLDNGFAYDHSIQPDINRKLAWLGSVNGSFGTIDLSQASDFITLKLCEEILPADLLQWIKLTRSPVIELPDGSVHTLKMVSTMGNGFTFPLQTLIFSAILAITYEDLNLKLRKRSRKSDPNFGVFGDDIIVLKGAYAHMIENLQKCGFKVNQTKSYGSGPFRESCGTDWYRGMFVRGVYATSLKTYADRTSLFNRLLRWSAETEIPLYQTLEVLLLSIPHRERFAVPPYDDYVSGIHVPLACRDARLLNVTTFVSQTLRIKLGATHGSIIYQRREVKTPRLIIFGKDGQLNRYYSRIPSAVFLAILQGSVRGSGCGIRSREPRYQNTFGVSPGWDFLRSGLLPNRAGSGNHSWIRMARATFAVLTADETRPKGT